MLNLLDFDCISYFDVFNFNEYPDHAPITVHLNLKPKNTKSETPSEDSFISRKLVWGDSKINLFHSQLLNNNETMQRLISDVNSESIDQVVQDFPRYFKVFGQIIRSESQPAPGKKVNNKRFDENCRNAKNEFKRARNIFNRTKSTETRVRFTFVHVREHVTTRPRKRLNSNLNVMRASA